MHWVIATTPDNQPTWVNLAAAMSMLRLEDKKVTLVFLGGVTAVYNKDGTATVHHANTQVSETPEQLMALPRQVPGASPAVTAKPADGRPRKGLPPSISAAVAKAGSRPRKTA